MEEKDDQIQRLKNESKINRSERENMKVAIDALSKRNVELEGKVKNVQTDFTTKKQEDHKGKCTAENGHKRL